MNINEFFYVIKIYLFNFRIFYLAGNSHALNFIIIKDFYLRRASNCLFAQRFTGRVCCVVGSHYGFRYFPSWRSYPRTELSRKTIGRPWIILSRCIYSVSSLCERLEMVKIRFNFINTTLSLSEPLIFKLTDDLMNYFVRLPATFKAVLE